MHIKDLFLRGCRHFRRLQPFLRRKPYQEQETRTPLVTHKNELDEIPDLTAPNQDKRDEQQWLTNLQREQTQHVQQWLIQMQQELKKDTQRLSSAGKPTESRSFQSKFRGLQHWFADKSLRDLKIALFLYEASRQEDAERAFTLDEIALGIHMAPNTMRVPPLNAGLLSSGVIQRSRHGRASYRYRSGLITFLETMLPEREPIEPLLPLLFYDTLKQRAKKTDPWLFPWLEQHQQQDLQKIQQSYLL